MERIVQIASDGSRLFGLGEDGSLFRLIEPHWVGGQGTVRVGELLFDQRDMLPGSKVWEPVPIFDFERAERL